MPFYTFKIMSLKTAAATGELVFGAVNEKQALERALYTARVSNGYACTGATGRCIYPKGPGADVVWVLPKERRHGP